MAKIIYKSNGKPEKKPRIYFASHPEDFSKEHEYEKKTFFYSIMDFIFPKFANSKIKIGAIKRSFFFYFLLHVSHLRGTPLTV